MTNRGNRGGGGGGGRSQGGLVIIHDKAPGRRQTGTWGEGGGEEGRSQGIKEEESLVITTHFAAEVFSCISPPSAFVAKTAMSRRFVVAGIGCI